MHAADDSRSTGNRVAIRFLRNREFEVRVRDHALPCDQPGDNGGQDKGPEPSEWFAAGVGACIGYYVLAYLDARSLPTAGLELETTWQTETAPKRIARIETRVVLPAGVPEVNHPRILQAAKRCLIHNTLHQPPEVTIAIRAAGNGDADVAAGQTADDGATAAGRDRQ
jgi:uncharacterized OsmC-like protein